MDDCTVACPLVLAPPVNPEPVKKIQAQTSAQLKKVQAALPGQLQKAKVMLQEQSRNIINKFNSRSKEESEKKLKGKEKETAKEVTISYSWSVKEVPERLKTAVNRLFKTTKV